MNTAVDTNVLLDVLCDSPSHREASLRLLLEAGDEGELVICEIVYAELAAAFRGKSEKLEAFLEDAGLRLVRTPVGALAEAGRLWRGYRDRGGPRTRMVADFLVGAHARAVSERLLTRDRGFYAAHFKGFSVWDPQVRPPADGSVP